MTLFVLLNHALNEVQISELKTRFGVQKIINLSENLAKKWSEIPPELDSLSEFLSGFKDFLNDAKKGDFVLIQGDFGATYLMVQYALNLGLTPIYATTKREVINDENGFTKKLFKHEKFRFYGE